MTTQDRFSTSPRLRPMVGKAGPMMVWSMAPSSMASVVPKMTRRISRCDSPTCGSGGAEGAVAGSAAAPAAASASVTGRLAGAVETRHHSATKKGQRQIIVLRRPCGPRGKPLTCKAVMWRCRSRHHPQLSRLCRFGRCLPCKIGCRSIAAASCASRRGRCRAVGGQNLAQLHGRDGAGHRESQRDILADQSDIELFCTTVLPAPPSRVGTCFAGYVSVKAVYREQPDVYCLPARPPPL